MDNCKDKRESVSKRTREALPAQGPRGSRSRCRGGPGAEEPRWEGAPRGRAAPGGHRGTFCSPVPLRSPEGHGRAGPGRGTGLKGGVAGPRGPEGTNASPGSCCQLPRTPGANASPAEESNGVTRSCCRHGRRNRAPLLPVKGNLAREGRRAARQGRASLPLNVTESVTQQRCPRRCRHGWPGVRAINCNKHHFPDCRRQPARVFSSLMEERAMHALTEVSQSPALRGSHSCAPQLPLGQNRKGCKLCPLSCCPPLGLGTFPKH